MNAAFAANSGAAILDDPAPESIPAPKSGMGWDYFEQVFPKPSLVCGRELKPLSIGRYRRMKRQNIAFVSDDLASVEKSSLVGDLLKGVLICSMTCADYDVFISQPDAEKQVKRWAQQVGFLPERYYDWPIIGKLFVKYVVGEKVTQLRNERAAAYLIEQVEMFQEYVLAAQKIPNYSNKSRENPRCTRHWSNSIELHLRSEQNWSTEEIDEAPLSKALADYFGHAEANGLISIHTDEQLSEAEENGKKLELLLAQLAKSKA